MKNSFIIALFLLLAARAAAQGKFFGGNGDGFATAQTAFVLPVHLLSFHAVRSGDDAAIRWEAETEGVQVFILERATPGSAFRVLAEVPAKQNNGQHHTYHYIDRQPAGTQYYRLKWTENNGAAGYSKVVPVSFPLTAAHAWYDAHSGCFMVSKPVDEVNIRLYRADGVLVRTIRSNDAVCRLPAHGLANGVYFILTTNSAAAGNRLRVLKSH